MKEYINKIKTLLIIFISIFILIQIYYRISHGSVFICIENNISLPKEKIDNYEIEIWWNNKKIKNLSISYNNMIPHEIIIKKAFGKNSLKIYRKDINKMVDYTMYSYLVTWVCIDINENDYNIHTSYFPQVIQ